jgi:hypothetical protein
MKYLKRFNESKEELNLQREELRDFCEMYLSYLIDEGFELYISAHEASDSELGYQTNFFKVVLKKIDDSLFLWEEISDRFIPFVKYLIDNYNLLKIDPKSTVPSIKKSHFNVYFETRHNIKFQSKELLEGASSLEGKKLRSISFIVGLPK